MFSLKKKILFIILLVFLIVLLPLIYFSRRPKDISSQISWGITFSKPFAEELGFDWQKVYLAILDDLKAKKIRLSLYWPDIEPSAENYFFTDYDWMIDKAREKGADLILVVGRRLPRWPECHVPDWAKRLNEKKQQEQVLELIEEIVKRYKDESNILAWQVENEPFFKFGNCPPLDAGFLDQEISLVRSLDIQRPIVLTDSGEFGRWLKAAKRADIFGTTIYRIVWSKYISYFKYPLPPRFFWLKANFIHLFYPGRKIIVSELQAEPWSSKSVIEGDLKEQFKSMSFEQFSQNIEYAEKVGFPEVYLWGAEWWYWLKENYNRSDFWDYAANLLSN